MSGGVPALWLSLLGDPSGPYDWTLETKPGNAHRVQPPYPHLDVVSVDVVPVERLAWQAIRVRGDHATGSGEVIIGRLVAQLRGGGEVELHRTAVGAAAVEAPAPIPTCGGCGLKIWAGPRVDEAGTYYHPGCTNG